MTNTVISNQSEACDLSIYSIILINFYKFLDVPYMLDHDNNYLLKLIILITYLLDNVVWIS